MLFLNHVKQEVNEKLTRLYLSVEGFLSESVRRLQGGQALALKPVRISKNHRATPYR